MLIGIMGKMGSGKTLSMSILAEFFHLKMNAPIYANYSLKGAERINNVDDLWEIDNGIVCLDELWITMDSREWGKDSNIKLTRWVNQTRKKKTIVMYTTQHIDQIEKRVRQGTDVLIYCEKKNGHWLNFIDWQYGQIMRKYLIAKPELFYSLYDTFEVVSILENKSKHYYKKRR